MKKIILAAALLITIVSVKANTVTSPETNRTSVIARNNSPIPQACVDAYNAMFPGAITLKWARKGEGVYQVTFTLNGQKSTARFSFAGVYLGK